MLQKLRVTAQPLRTVNISAKDLSLLLQAALILASGIRPSPFDRLDWMREYARISQETCRKLPSAQEGGEG